MQLLSAMDRKIGHMARKWQNKRLQLLFQHFHPENTHHPEQIVRTEAQVYLGKHIDLPFHQGMGKPLLPFERPERVLR